MFVIGNLLIAIGQVLDFVLTIYFYIVIVRALISWVNPDPYNVIVQFLHRATDPVLRPLQRAIPPLGGIDVSPLVLLLAIMFLKSFLVASLMQFGRTLHG